MQYIEQTTESQSLRRALFFHVLRNILCVETEFSPRNVFVSQQVTSTPVSASLLFCTFSDFSKNSEEVMFSGKIKLCRCFICTHCFQSPQRPRPEIVDFSLNGKAV